MKRCVIPAVFFSICLVFPTPMMAHRNKVTEYRNKETTIDMSNMKRVFVSWVDLPTEEGALYGYEIADWIALMTGLNQSLAHCVADRTVTAAKDKDDTNFAGNDLYIKFQDVRIDYEHYHLIVGIHFIDPKTNTEIGMITARPYYGNDWGF